MYGPSIYQMMMNSLKLFGNEISSIAVAGCIFPNLVFHLIWTWLRKPHCNWVGPVSWCWPIVTITLFTALFSAMEGLQFIFVLHWCLMSRLNEIFLHDGAACFPILLASKSSCLVQINSWENAIAWTFALNVVWSSAKRKKIQIV